MGGWPGPAAVIPTARGQSWSPLLWNSSGPGVGLDLLGIQLNKGWCPETDRDQLRVKSAPRVGHGPWQSAQPGGIRLSSRVGDLTRPETGRSRLSAEQMERRGGCLGKIQSLKDPPMTRRWQLPI